MLLFLRFLLSLTKKALTLRRFVGFLCPGACNYTFIIYIRRQQFICRFKVDRIQEKAKKIRDNKFYV